MLTLLVKFPALVGSVVTVPEGQVSVVSVLSTVDIEALSSVVLEVSSVSSVPSDFIGVISLECSDDSSNSNSETLSSLVGESEVSLGGSSDRVSSLVKNEPLLIVSWVVVSNSESVLFSSDVFSMEDSSSSWHS